MGTAYLFFGKSGGLGGTTIDASSATAPNGAKFYGTVPYQYFGASLGPAGDLNGDGYGDIRIGAPAYDTSSTITDNGALFVYYGNSGTTLDTNYDAMFTGTTAVDNFCTDAAYLDRVNDNGTSVIIGVPLADGAGLNMGAVSMYTPRTRGPLILSPDQKQKGTGTASYNFTIKNTGYVAETLNLTYTSSLGWTATIVEVNGTLMTPTSAYTTSTFAIGATMTIRINITIPANAAYALDTTVVTAKLTNSNPVVKGNTTLLTINSIDSAANYTGTAPEQAGTSVSNAGDVNGDGYSDIIVGAPGYSSNTGIIYIYFGSGTTPLSNIMSGGNRISLSAPAGARYFGISVSTLGDVNGDGYDDVIIGANGTNTAGTDAGSAYVFFGRPDIKTSPPTSPNMTLLGEAAYNYFGYSVSTAGDINNDGYSDFIIGAPGYSSSKGRAYLYLGSKSPSAVAAGDPALLTGSSNNDRFGMSVSWAGKMDGDAYDDVIIGAPGSTNMMTLGYARVYYGTAGTGGFSVYAGIRGEAIGDWFGFSVSGTGDLYKNGRGNIVVGAPYNDTGGLANTGKAYLFTSSKFESKPTGDTLYALTDSYITMVGDTGRALFGWAVNGIGDFNNDTYPDFAVSVPKYPLIDTNMGVVCVYFGGPSLDSNWDAAVYGEGANHQFGRAICGGCDMNGDNITEMLVGAPYYSTNAGKAYLFNISYLKFLDAYPNQIKHSYPGYNITFTITLKNNIGAGRVNIANTSTYDWSVSIAEGGVPITDHGTDGVPDVSFAATGTKTLVVNATIQTSASPGTRNVIIVTAYNETTPTTLDAVVLTIVVDESTFTPTTTMTIVGDSPSSQLGYSMTYGDINGDGYDDIIAGAPYYDSGDKTDNGAVFIYYGGSTLSTTPSVTLLGPSENGACFGWNVTSGDVNADGYADVVVGAPFMDYSGKANSGCAFVFYGSNSLVVGTTKYTTDSDVNTIASGSPNSPNTDKQFGWSVCASGDINGDGYDDIVVGEPGTQSSSPAIDPLVVKVISSITPVTWGTSNVGYVYYSELFDGKQTFMVSSTFTLTSIRFYGGQRGGAWIWADLYTATNTLLGTSQRVYAAAPGNWNILPFPTSITLTPGSYYFSPHSTDTANDWQMLNQHVKTGVDGAFWWRDGGAYIYMNSYTGYTNTYGGGYYNGAATASWSLLFEIYGTASSIGTTVSNNYAESAATAYADSYYQTFKTPASSTIVITKMSVRWSGTGKYTSAGLYRDSDDGRIGWVDNSPVYSGGNGNEVHLVFATSSGGSPGKIDLAANTVYRVRLWCNGQSYGYYNTNKYSDGSYQLQAPSSLAFNIYGYYSSVQPVYSDASISVFYGGSTISTTSDIPTKNGKEQSPDATYFDRFGQSVSMGDFDGDGYDDIVVGAPNWAGGIQKGRVYLFKGTPTKALESPWLVLNGENNGNYFGASVGMANFNGDGYSDIVIGAPFYNYTGTTLAGKAYILYGGTSSFTNPYSISAAIGATIAVAFNGSNIGDNFGASVSYAGDLNKDGYDDIIIGAPFCDKAQTPDSGKVYIYYGSTTLSVNTVPDMTFDGIGTSDRLGFSVSYGGKVDNNGPSILMSAPYYLNSNQKGGIGIYTALSGSLQFSPDQSKSSSTSGTLTYDFTITNNGAVNDTVTLTYMSSQGWTATIVEIDGTLKTPAVSYTTNLLRTGSTTTIKVNITMYSPLGVGMVEDITVVTGQFTNTNPIVKGNITLKSINYSRPAVDKTGSSNAQLGYSIADAGDVNGDGYNDIIVGAPGANSGQGVAYLYLGASWGSDVSIKTTPVIFSAYSIYAPPTSGFGTSVASAGDVNGDGYADVIIGAPNTAYNVNGNPSCFSTGNLESNAGTVYIFFGKATLSDTGIPDVILTGESDTNYFGCAVASMGDTNNDGYDDVMVGAYGYGSYQGSVYIYYGGKTIENAPSVILRGTANSQFGFSLSKIPDLTGDAVPEFMVGAPNYGATSAGAVFIYRGNSFVLHKQLTGDTQYISFGYSISVAGYADRDDELSDIVIGAPNANIDTKNYAGKVYIYRGALSMGDTPYATILGSDSDAKFGTKVSFVGKFNDSGYDTILISAPYRTLNTSMYEVGTVYLYNSSDTTKPLATFNGDARDAKLGWAIAAADSDNDNYKELIIGTPYYLSNSGKFYIYKRPPAYLPEISIYADQSQQTMQGKTIYYNLTVKNNATSSNTIVLSLDMLASQTDILPDSVYKFHTNDGWYIEFLDSGGAPMSSLAITRTARNTTTDNLTFMVKITAPTNANAATNTTVIRAAVSGTPSKCDIATLQSVVKPYQSVWSTPTSTFAPSDASGFGLSAASNADINGDGYSDIVIGAPYTASNTGSVYVYYGSPVINTQQPNIIISGEKTGDYFGWSVAAGDVNGDGYADIIIGAPYATHSYAGQGKVYVVFGKSESITSSKTIQAYTIANQTNVGTTIYSPIGGASAPFIVANTVSAFGFNLTVADLNWDGRGDIIVGAPVNNSQQGTVFVFFGSTNLPNALSIDNVRFNGEWATSGRFGWSLAAGDADSDRVSDLFVGAPAYNSNQGRVYIFYGSAALANINVTDTSVTRFTDDTEKSNCFGHSISVGYLNSDNYLDLVVGVPFRNQNYSLQAAKGVIAAGRVFVFNGTWSKGSSVVVSTAILGGTGQGFLIDGTHLYANFGASVSVTTDINKDGYNDILVGAPGDYMNGHVPSGKAYLYYCGPNIADNVSDRSYSGAYLLGAFGTSVDAAGDVNGDGFGDILIGAPSAGSSGKGEAYLYTTTQMGSISFSPVKTVIGNISFPTQNTTQDITVRNNGINDTALNISWQSQNRGVGWNASVYNASMSNPATGVGTPFTYYEETTNGSGYAILILPPGSQAILKVNTTIPKDASYGATNDVTITAAINGTAITNTVTVRSLASKSQAEVPMVVGRSAGDRFGTSAASAGDVNGDGYMDTLIGAPGFNSNQGKVYLYLGGSGGKSYSASSIITFQVTGTSYFGVSVDSAGDVNGDGYGDIIIGANGTTVGSLSNAGTAYIFYGGLYVSGSTITTPDRTLLGQSPNSQFGYSVAGVGDINSDGYDDVAVGAYGYDNFNGAVYVYLGGSNMDSLPDVFLGDAYNTGTYIASPTYTTKLGSWFGYSVKGKANIKDSSGEALPDVIIGAPGYGSYQGRIYIYTGKPSTSMTPSGEKWTNAAEGSVIEAQSDEKGDEKMFGYSIGVLGDLDNDGFSEIIVGAPNSNGGDGRARVIQGVYLGSLWTVTGSTSSNFGSVVTRVGDIRGDIKDDGTPQTWSKGIAVGAYAANVQGYTRAGTVSVYYYNGLTIPFNATADVSLNLNPLNSNDWFGYALADGGGVTGNKYDELLVGAPLADTDQNNLDTGKLFFYNFSTKPGTNRNAVLITPSQQKTVTVNSGMVNYIMYVKNNQATSKTYNIEISGMRSDWSIKSVTYKSGGTGSLTLVPPSAYQLKSALAANGAVEINISISISSSTPITTPPTTDVTTVKAVDKDDPAKSDSITLTTKVVGLEFTASLQNNTPIRWDGDSTSTYTGMVVVNGTDINGDGLADVVIGAPYRNGGLGCVYIIYGKPDWKTNQFTASIANPSKGADVTLDPSRYGLAAPANFGASIATGILTTGDNITDLVIGAPGNNSKGAIFVFSGLDIKTYPTSVMPKFRIDHLTSGVTLAAGDRFGSSLATGDLDGDGLDDIAASAPYGIGYGTSSGGGRVYIFRGVNFAAGTYTYYCIAGMATNDHFGWSLGAVDIDGALTSPIIASASASNSWTGHTPDKAVNGKTALDVGYENDGWIGSPTGVKTDYWKLNLGVNTIVSKIRIYNNVNSTGGNNYTSSLNISTSLDDTTYITLRSLTSLANPSYAQGAWNEFIVEPTLAKWIKIDGFNFNNYGTSYWGEGVACLGEVQVNSNRTLTEFLVGAPDTDSNGADSGSVFIYKNYSYATGDGPGSSSPSLAATLGQYEMAIKGEVAGDKFGYSVSGVGPVAPGYSNGTIIGAPYKKISNLSEVGRAYLTYSGLSFTAGATPPNNYTVTSLTNLIMDGNTAGSRFGWNVSYIGDINCDTYADWMVGAPYTNYTGMANAGAAYLYLGSTTDISSPYCVPTRAWYGSAANELLGWDVGGGSDDGANNSQKGTQQRSIDTILIGSPGYSGYTGRVTMLSNQMSTSITGVEVAVSIYPRMGGNPYADSSANLNPSDPDYYNLPNKLFYRKSGAPGKTLIYQLTVKNLGSTSDIIGITCDVTPNNGGTWYNSDPSYSYIVFSSSSSTKIPIERYSAYPTDKDPTGQKWDLSNQAYKHIYLDSTQEKNIYVWVTIPASAGFNSNGETIRLKIESLNKTYTGRSDISMNIADPLCQDVYGLGQGHRYSTWEWIELRTVISKSVAFVVTVDSESYQTTPGGTVNSEVRVLNDGPSTESTKIEYDADSDVVKAVIITRQYDGPPTSWATASPTTSIQPGVDNRAHLLVNVTIREGTTASMTNVTIFASIEGYTPGSVMIPIIISKKAVEFITQTKAIQRIPGEPRTEDAISVKIRRTNATADSNWQKIAIYATNESSPHTEQPWLVKLTKPNSEDLLSDDYKYDSGTSTVISGTDGKYDTTMASQTDPSFFEFYVWVTVPTVSSGTVCTIHIYTYPIMAGDSTSTRSELTITITVSSNYLMQIWDGAQQSKTITTGPDHTEYVELTLKNRGNQPDKARLGYTTTNAIGNPASWDVKFLYDTRDEIPASVDTSKRETNTIPVDSYINIVVKLTTPKGSQGGDPGYYYANLTVYPTGNPSIETRFTLTVQIMEVPTPSVVNVTNDFKTSYKDSATPPNVHTNNDFGDYTWAGTSDTTDTANNTIVYPVNVTNNGNIDAISSNGKVIICNITNYTANKDGTEERSYNEPIFKVYVDLRNPSEYSVPTPGELSEPANLWPSPTAKFRDITENVTDYAGRQGQWMNLTKDEKYRMFIKVTIPAEMSSTGSNNMLKINVSAVDKLKEPKDEGYFIPFGNGTMKITTGIGPDFKITNSDIKVSVRGAIRGQTIKFVITVKNTGYKGNATVKIYDVVDKNGNGIVDADESLPTPFYDNSGSPIQIDSGKSTNIYFEYEVTSASKHIFLVKLSDSNGKEAEGESTDNEAPISLDIVSMPVDTATSFDPGYLAIALVGMVAAGLGSVRRKDERKEKR
ncbi:MAG: FG-GAP-like repeat-containing protein [Thermoplasmata archaeon]